MALVMKIWHGTFRLVPYNDHHHPKTNHRHHPANEPEQTFASTTHETFVGVRHLRASGQQYWSSVQTSAPAAPG